MLPPIVFVIGQRNFAVHPIDYIWRIEVPVQEGSDLLHTICFTAFTARECLLIAYLFLEYC